MSENNGHKKAVVEYKEYEEEEEEGLKLGICGFTGDVCYLGFMPDDILKDPQKVRDYCSMCAKMRYAQARLLRAKAIAEATIIINTL